MCVKIGIAVLLQKFTNCTLCVIWSVKGDVSYLESLLNFCTAKQWSGSQFQRQFCDITQIRYSGKWSYYYQPLLTFENTAQTHLRLEMFQNSCLPLQPLEIQDQFLAKKRCSKNFMDSKVQGAGDFGRILGQECSKSFIDARAGGCQVTLRET